MAKPPFLNPRKKVLDFATPAPKTSTATDPRSSLPLPELKVGGRRYRLVLLDPEDPVEEVPPGAELLTPRELQIVALVASGHVNKQVADVLRISEWTVSTHLRRIFAKLGVDTRAAMVSRCFGGISLLKTDAS